MAVAGVGLRVREARQSRAMSLTDLARSSKLSKGFLSQLENGATDPSLGSLSRLAAALDVTLSALLVDEPTMPATSTGMLRVVRHMPAPVGRSSVRVVNRSERQVAALVEVAPRARVVGSGTAASSFILTVTGGAVCLICQGTPLRLFEGDSAAWGGTGEYELANLSGSRATLLLVIAGNASLPTLIDPVFARPTEMPEKRQSGKGGPLRLVAMRAARTAEHGR